MFIVCLLCFLEMVKQSVLHPRNSIRFVLIDIYDTREF